MSDSTARPVLVPDPSGDAAALLAIAMFQLSAAKQIAAMAVALAGADMIVFTGGIGENDAATREAICDRLAWFGVALDDGHGEPTPGGTYRQPRCRALALPSQEDEQIARHAALLIDA